MCKLEHLKTGENAIVSGNQKKNVCKSEVGYG